MAIVEEDFAVYQYRNTASFKAKYLVWQTITKEQYEKLALIEKQGIKEFDRRRLVDESFLIASEKAHRKAVQQLAETNRQLQTGLSFGGRQFYGTAEDIQWLQSELAKREAQGSAPVVLYGYLSELKDAAADECSCLLMARPDSHSSQCVPVYVSAAMGGDDDGSR